MPVTPSALPSTTWVVVPFQPMPAPPASTPYLPLAKMPTNSTPRVPHTPCTDMAPTGSSTLSRRSMKYTASTTTHPAMMPMTMAAQGSTKAHGAVMATRPASMPLAIMAGSGLPERNITQNMQATEPKAPAMAVFTATVANCGSELANVDAALKPNQPNSRMNVPSMAMGMLWPG